MINAENNMRNSELQDKLDKIQFFLARTTESFDDWDYDGDELILFDGEIIEKYSAKDIDGLLHK